MMSREKLTNTEKNAIIRRFIEVCGSDEPAHIKQLLKISYQGARNYIKSGRIPTTEILLAVAEHTPYSIHWLLTGQGNKFVYKGPSDDTLILTDEMRASFREIGVEVFNELFEERRAEIVETQRMAESKVVVLQTNKLKSEKAIENSIAVPEKETAKETAKEAAPPKKPLT